MRQYIQALEAQSTGLQALVCELLQKNQELRAQLHTLRLADIAESPRRPLIHHHAQIIQLLDDRLHLPPNRRP